MPKKSKMNDFRLTISMKTTGACLMLKMMSLMLKAFVYLQKLKCRIMRQPTFNITCHIETE